MYVKVKIIFRANLLNYKNGWSQTDYDGNVADNYSSCTKSSQPLKLLYFLIVYFFTS